MSKITIAIDGYSSCGKSSTAKEVAKMMQYAYIDTGAMYRAVTLYFLENHVSLYNPKEVERALENIDIKFRRNELAQNDTFLNGLNVEEAIRDMKVANFVSEVSAIAAVRHDMVKQQQRMGRKAGVVLDGRDIGTVVFPTAELKIFMTAQPLIRAQRRQQELLDKGQMVDIDEVLENLLKRDHIDATRDEGPLRQAEDALVLDTSYLTLEEQIDKVCIWADLAISKKLRNA
jgi:CMP/dCMP kinase